MPHSRRLSRRGASAAILAGAVLGGAPGAASADAVDSRVVFAFTDRAIIESSGLVDRGPLMLTVNDSGDDPVIYSVSRRTGETVAVTTYSSEDVSDVEALAPGPDGAAWVGDVGDNDEERSTLDVYRVLPLRDPELRAGAVDGGGDAIEEEVPAERFSVVYPDSAHNAEALLVHPDTGRVYVVTKDPAGGTVYAAPASLDAGSANRMEEIGRVPGSITDGSFFPDGEHIMLRTYGDAVVYTFPGLRPVGEVDLPFQQQGETLAVSEGGDVYIGSEGAYSEVLQILLPPRISSAIGDAPRLGTSASPRPNSTAPTPTGPTTSGPTSTGQPPTGQPPVGDSLSTGDGAGVWVAAGILVLTIAGWLLFTVARRRSRHNP